MLKTATLRLSISGTAQCIDTRVAPLKSLGKNLQLLCVSFLRHVTPSWRTDVTEFLLSCLFFIVYYYYYYSADEKIKYQKIHCIYLYETFSMLFKADLPFKKGKIIDLDEWPWPISRKSDLNWRSPFCKICLSDCISDFTNMFGYKNYVSDRKTSDLDQWPWPLWPIFRFL